MQYDCPAIVATGPAGELSCVDDLGASVAWVVVDDSDETSEFWDSSLTLDDVSTLLSAILFTLVLAYGFRQLSRLIQNTRG